MENAEEIHITRPIKRVLRNLLHNRPFLADRTDSERKELKCAENIYTLVFELSNQADDRNSANSDVDDDFATSNVIHGLPSRRILRQERSADDSLFLYDDQDVFDFISSIGRDPEYAFSS